MNEHEEYWQKEFASLAEEEPEPVPEPRVQKKTSKFFFASLSTILISLIVLSVATRIFWEQGQLYWEPNLLIQGGSFFAFWFLMAALFYFLEDRDLATVPVDSNENH